MTIATEHYHSVESHVVAVIGAGVGGLTFGIGATRKWGQDFDFVIYERASDIGGTWRANEYPGCSCDIAVHFYSLSTDLNPSFTQSHPCNGALLAYWQSLADKYSLYRHLEFRQDVTQAQWDPSTSEWNLSITNLDNGTRKLIKARFLVSALGILEVPNYGGIKGLDTFGGQWFHSAVWNKDVDIKGKRVGVVGNGASATQFVPVITNDEETKVVQFVRTPNWYVMDVRFKFSETRIWLFKYIPFLLRIYRWIIFCRSELLYILLFTFKMFRNLMMAASRKYIQKRAPKELHSFLLPKYEMGCKRIILDTGYLDALHRPNLTLNQDGIEEIVPEGIKTNTGQVIPFDVIILGTGYVADKYPLEVIGRTGERLEDYYEKKGGPTAYRGTTVPGFPNLWVLGGPNTTTGHTSVIYTEECQVNYTIQCISRLLDKNSGVVGMDVKESACAKYNKWLEKRFEGKGVFYTCHSWYRVGGVGKVSSIWPGSSTLFWWKMRKVDWKDYNWIVEGKKEE